MCRKGKISFQDICLEFEFVLESRVAEELIQTLPVTSIASNIGGEIYFRVPHSEIEYDGTQKDVFQPGDVVYWRDPFGEKKFSVAILYGNTSFGNWKVPKTFSPCVKIGSILKNPDVLKTVKNNERVTIEVV